MKHAWPVRTHNQTSKHSQKNVTDAMHANLYRCSNFESMIISFTAIEVEQNLHESVPELTHEKNKSINF